MQVLLENATFLVHKVITIVGIITVTGEPYSRKYGIFNLYHFYHFKLSFNNTNCTKVGATIYEYEHINILHGPTCDKYYSNFTHTPEFSSIAHHHIEIGAMFQKYHSHISQL